MADVPRLQARQRLPRQGAAQGMAQGRPQAALEGQRRRQGLLVGQRRRRQGLHHGGQGRQVVPLRHRRGQGRRAALERRHRQGRTRELRGHALHPDLQRRPRLRPERLRRFRLRDRRQGRDQVAEELQDGLRRRLGPLAVRRIAAHRRRPGDHHAGRQQGSHGLPQQEDGRGDLADDGRQGQRRGGLRLGGDQQRRRRQAVRPAGRQGDHRRPRFRRQAALALRRLRQQHRQHPHADHPGATRC